MANSQALNQTSSSISNSILPSSILSTFSMTPSVPGSSRSTLSKHLPKCIIIGARKCGTRALLEFLDTHPRIRKVTDELHFFDDDARYALGLGWYHQQMPLAAVGDVVIEKTPAYFVTEAAPERLYAMNSSIKIILIVRDPVTRLISDYAQLASNRAKKDRMVPTFEEEILLPSGKINANYKGIRISLYAIYFNRWIKVRMHFLNKQLFLYWIFYILAFLEAPNSCRRRWSVCVRSTAWTREDWNLPWTATWDQSWELCLQHHQGFLLHSRWREDGWTVSE